MSILIRTLPLLLLLVSRLTLAAPQPLLEVEQLASMLEQPQVQLIDIRPTESYQAGHIGNAVSAPYLKWRGPANNPGQLLSLEKFQQLVQELGLTKEMHLVVYSTGADETDFGAAARVYWTLKYLGFEQLSLLNGGYSYWLQAQQPVSQQAQQLAASSLTLEPKEKLSIDTDELRSYITSQRADYQLLDSRPESFFLGRMKAPTASVGGTIAGASNLPFGQWFIPGETRVLPAAQIQQLVSAQQLQQAEESISFCNTGHWAATNWFVLSELAGVKNVRLYPASMAEWTQHAQSLPMDNTPARWEQIKTKFAQLGF